MLNNISLDLLPKVAPEISRNETLPTKAPMKQSPTSFSSILDSYINLVENTGQLELQVDQMQIDYATGKTDDMVSLLLAQQKALASLNFTVQVTNKALQAYQEIMRINM